MNKQLIKTSKFLSLVLRHKPEAIGITLDRQGWVRIDVLLKAMQENGRAIKRSTLEEIVETNDKKRFAISTDGLSIRANQGHSLDVELDYAPKKPPAHLYHGTATRFLGSIFKEGLTKQNRHHVHMTENRETAKQVGSRYGKVVLLLIDAQRMFDDGHIFYLAENNVWLCDAVPNQYLSEDKGG